MNQKKLISNIAHINLIMLHLNNMLLDEKLFNFFKIYDYVKLHLMQKLNVLFLVKQMDILEKYDKTKYLRLFNFNEKYANF